MLKTTRTAVLTVAALDILWEQDSCCPLHCGMCWVLQDMTQKGDLNDVLRKAPIDMVESSEWWLRDRPSVNLTALTTKWAEPCEECAGEAKNEEDEQMENG